MGYDLINPLWDSPEAAFDGLLIIMGDNEGGEGTAEIPPRVINAIIIIYAKVPLGITKQSNDQPLEFVEQV